MTARPRVLVTGADQHQGLAVIRGLGLAGIPVVACGPCRWSLGFHSRYTVERAPRQHIPHRRRQQRLSRGRNRPGLFPWSAEGLSRASPSQPELLA